VLTLELNNIEQNFNPGNACFTFFIEYDQILTYERQAMFMKMWDFLKCDADKMLDVCHEQTVAVCAYSNGLLVFVYSTTCADCRGCYVVSDGRGRKS
jgi:hypothetical protein